MPIYQYRCEACGHKFSHKQRMSDEPLSVCPRCEGAVRRIIQPVGVIFKGSGFYITDNRQVSSPTLSSPKEGAKAKEEGGSGAESEPSTTKETPAPVETPAKSEAPGTTGE